MADVKNITENKIFEEIIKTKNMISLGEEIPLCKVATTSDLQEMESNITNILSSQFKMLIYHSMDICTVTIKNIKNMHAISTNQIADILHFNDKVFKKLRKN